jgi:RES domain-containing protein
LRFVGTAYRAHNPRWSFRPTSGDGAAIHGGRFNPKGMPALYLSVGVITAIKEANQAFAHKMEPYVLCSYEIDCEDIANLGDDAARNAAGVEESVLSAAWFAHVAAGTTPPQWTMVIDLVARGSAGALVPSYAPGAMASERNLVLWKWGPDLPHKISVHDPSGRLPKNQLSWD